MLRPERACVGGGGGAQIAEADLAANGSGSHGTRSGGVQRWPIAEKEESRTMESIAGDWVLVASDCASHLPSLSQ